VALAASAQTALQGPLAWGGKRMKCEQTYRQIIDAGFALIDIDEGVYLFKRQRGNVERICMDSNGNIYRGKTLDGARMELAEITNMKGAKE
jgi:hypothetical protein